MQRRFVVNVHPGCDRVFTGPADQAVLDQVQAHAAADHDVTRPTMAYIEQVVIANRPLTPGRAGHRRLTLGGATPPDHAAADAGAGHRAGLRLRPVGASGHGADQPAAAVTALTRPWGTSVQPLALSA